MSEHVVRHFLSDLGSIFDGGAEVDAAPDPCVGDFVLEVTQLVEMAVSEPGDAGHGEVDVSRAEELRDRQADPRGRAGVSARIRRSDYAAIGAVTNLAS